MSERLRDVLAAHREDGSYPDTCVCEVEVPDDIEGHWSAHVESAVLTWLGELLGGDEAREVVSRAVAIHDDYDCCFERLDGTDPEEPLDTDVEDCEWWRGRATAALAAVRALVTETSNEGDE